MGRVTTYPVPIASTNPQPTGIVLALYSASSTRKTEIQRAPSNADGDPNQSSAVTLDVVDGSVSTFIDALPLSETAAWHYRIRHIAKNCDPSDWLEWSDAYHAVILPDVTPPIPTLDFVRVFKDPSQYESSGTQYGRIDLTIKDPAFRVESVAYQLRDGDAFTYQGPEEGTTDRATTWYTTGWNAQEGAVGVDRVLTRQKDVTLHAKRQHGIKWRVIYRDVDGKEIVYIDAWDFDIDRKPNVSFALSVFGTSAFLSWTGDEDTKSVRYVAHVNPSPDDAPTAAELTAATGCGNGRQNDGVEVLTDLSSGDKVYVRARGYSEEDCAGNMSTVDWSTRLTYLDTDSGIPHVEATYSQEDTTGSTSLTIIDPNQMVVASEFIDKVGNGDWETWSVNGVGGTGTYDAANYTSDPIDPANGSHETALDAKHNSSVQWRVYYRDGVDENGNDIIRYIDGTHTFDIDTIPDVKFNVSIFGTTALLSWEGDEDTASIRYVAQVNPDPDDAPTATELDAGTVQASQSHDGLEIATDLVANAKIYIRARGYRIADGSGNQSGQDFSTQLTYPATVSDVPHVEATYSQTGNTGTTTLTIIDPGEKVVASEFIDKVGNADWETWSVNGVGGTGTYDTADYTSEPIDPANGIHETALHGKHNSSVQWRVYYRDGEDEDGNDIIRHLDGTHTFDIDTVPDVRFSLSIFGTAAVLSWQGDEDTNSIRYVVHVDPDPDDGPTAAELTAGTVSAHQSHEGLEVATGLSTGNKIYVRARGYRAVDGTGTQSVRDFATRLTYPEVQDGIPYVEASYSQSGNTGTTTLTIVDPQEIVTATDFADKVGSASWETFPTSDYDEADYDNDDPPNNIHTTAIDAKHNSSVQWRVYYHAGEDEDGNDIIRYVGSSHTFDVDTVPDVRFSLSIFGTAAVLSWQGDEDTNSIRYVVHVDPDPDDAPTAAELTAGTVSAHQSHEGLEVATGLSTGKKIYVRARGYREADGTGRQSERDFATRLTYPEAESRIPIVTPAYTQDGITGTTDLTILDPANAVTAVDFVNKAGNADEEDWGGSNRDTVKPFDTMHEVTIYAKHNSITRWRVEYDSGDTDDQGDPIIRYLEGAHTFDIDKIAEIVNVSVRFVDVNNHRIQADIQFDEDVVETRTQFSTVRFSDSSLTSSEVTAFINNAAGYQAGDDTIDIDGLSPNAIAVGAVFTIDGQTTIYEITDPFTISAGGTATIDIEPALSANVGDNVELTFTALSYTSGTHTIDNEDIETHDSDDIGTDRALRLTSDNEVQFGGFGRFFVHVTNQRGADRIITTVYKDIHRADGDAYNKNPDSGDNADDIIDGTVDHALAGRSAISPTDNTQWEGALGEGVEVTDGTNREQVASVIISPDTPPPDREAPHGCLWLRVSSS